MKKVKQVQAASGHSIAIFSYDKLFEASKLFHEHPADDRKYSHFYVAKNFDENGASFFYLAKGYHDGNTKASNEIHVWYRNKKMWSGFGNNFEDAINGAQRDGWLHAD